MSKNTDNTRSHIMQVINSKTSFSAADGATLVRGGYPMYYQDEPTDAIVYTELIEGMYERVTTSAQRVAFDSARVSGGLVADFEDFLLYDINVIDFDGEYITASFEPKGR